MIRVLVSLLFALTLGFSTLATAETLEELPFAKKLDLANVGDEDAQMAVASAYEQGSGAKKNIAEAAKWYRQAALAGNVEAQFRLARIVSKGAKGLTKDLKTAVKLYEAAAKSGHLEAFCYQLLGPAFPAEFNAFKASDAAALKAYKEFLKASPLRPQHAPLPDELVRIK